MSWEYCSTLPVNSTTGSFCYNVYNNAYYINHITTTGVAYYFDQYNNSWGMHFIETNEFFPINSNIILCQRPIQADVACGSNYSFDNSPINLLNCSGYCSCYLYSTYNSLDETVYFTYKCNLLLKKFFYNITCKSGSPQEEGNYAFNPEIGYYDDYEFGSDIFNSIEHIYKRGTQNYQELFESLINASGNGLIPLDSGTVTYCSGNILRDDNKNWNTNTWSNFSVFIYEGSGGGYCRRIVSNSNNQLTTNDTFNQIGYNPTSSGDKYFIWPPIDVYSINNNNINTSRYSYISIYPSTESSVVLSPSIPRGGTPGNGFSFNWIYNTSDPSIDYRRIYSFRGGNTNTLDYYDINTNSWVNDIQYNKGETFGIGSKYVYPGGDWIYIQKDNTGRWFRFNVVTHTMEPWGTCLYPQGTAIAGNTAFYTKHQTPSGEITYIHMILNSSNIHVRKMVL